MCVTSIEEFLSEGWWAGVQGVFAAVGLLAIVLAVIEFIVYQNDSSAHAIRFVIWRAPDVVDGTREVSVTVQVMGPKVLYQPKWKLYTEPPSSWFESPPLPTTLSVHDEPITIEMTVPAEAVDTTRVAITWVNPKRWSSHAEGSRVELKRGGRMEHWRLYRWRRWPRKHAGRWVDPGNLRPNHSLIIP